MTGAGQLSNVGMTGAGLLSDSRVAADRLALGRETVATGVSEGKKERDWQEKMAERGYDVYSDKLSEERGRDWLKFGINAGLGLLKP